jgi:hypothetical protein
VGWLAQWEEMLCDPEQKIARPGRSMSVLVSVDLFRFRTANKRMSATAIRSFVSSIASWRTRHEPQVLSVFLLSLCGFQNRTLAMASTANEPTIGVRQYPPSRQRYMNMTSASNYRAHLLT